MTKKCEVCGKITKHPIKCKRCLRDICFLGCFNSETGYCPDCDIIMYDAKYKQLIQAYENHEKNINSAM